MFESKSATKRWHWIAGRVHRVIQWEQRCSPDGLTHTEVPLDEVGCEYHHLSQIVVPEEDHCLCVMRPEHLRHECFDHFDVGVPLRCVLYSINFPLVDALEKDGDRVTSMCIPFGSSLFHEPCTTRTCTISRVSGSKCLLKMPLVAMVPIQVANLTLQNPCRRGS